MGLPDWLKRVLAYLAPGWRVVAMRGKEQPEAGLWTRAAEQALAVVSGRAYLLLFSGEERQVAASARVE